MRFIVEMLSGLTRWLESRFPEKMTTRDVMAKFIEYETRLAILEKQEELKRLRADVQKIKLFSGIAAITGVNGD